MSTAIGSLPSAQFHGLLETIGEQPWLLGALLSVGGAVLGAIGLTAQKAAQYRYASEFQKVGSTIFTRTPYRKLVACPSYWLGVGAVVLHRVITLFALSYAPETTVAPLGAVKATTSLSRLVC